MITLLERAAPARLRRFHTKLLPGASVRPFSQFHILRSVPSLLGQHRNSPYSFRNPPCQKTISRRGYGARSSSTPQRSDIRDDGNSASDIATPTDFAKLDVLGHLPQPGGSIDSCLKNGFNFSSGLTVTGAVLIVGGEVFRWFPTRDEPRSPNFVSPLLSDAGQWQVEGGSFGALEVVWPKPDLLVIGTGRTTEALSPNVKKLLNDMGIRVEVVNTRNAAAQYNLLAAERGIHEVAAALVPAGWKAEMAKEASRGQ